MVHDPPNRVYIPLFYTITTARTAATYTRMLRFVMEATNQQLRPAQVVVDFDQALIDSVGVIFPDARIVGCFFHFKQATRRRMVAQRIPAAEVGLAMEVGVLDMLTVIPAEHVDPHGIAFVVRKIRRECRSRGIAYYAQRWTEFWEYFRRTWLVRFGVDVWNVHGMDLTVVSRTNNPLERFYREINASIATPHPNLPVFVGAIDALSRRYAQLLNDITNRRATAPAVGNIHLPVVVNALPRRARAGGKGRARRGRPARREGSRGRARRAGVEGAR